MTFGERLTSLRLESEYTTRKQLAEKLGIPETTLRNYEKDVREPGHTFLIQISEFFNVSIDWLLGVCDEKERKTEYQLTNAEYSIIEHYRSLDKYGREMVEYTLTHETKRMNDIRVLTKEVSEMRKEKARRRIYTYHGKIAAAGTFVLPGDEVGKYEEYDECEHDADFTVGVSGDSMEPTYYDGDIVFVKDSDHVNKGEIGIFQKDGYIYIKEAGDGYLLSHNPNYPPMNGEGARCLGKVVGKAVK